MEDKPLLLEISSLINRENGLNGRIKANYKGEKVIIRIFSMNNFTTEELNSIPDILKDWNILSKKNGSDLSIVKLIGYCIEELENKERNLLIVSEYHENEMTLEEKVKDGGNYCSRSLRIGYCIKVAYILRSMHFDKQIAHKNLQPSNIMIIGEKVKLTEIGIFRILEMEAYHKYGQKIYLTNYSTPEYISERKCDIQSDIWNFGLIIWQMITKSMPYSEKSSLSSISFAITKGETPTL
eukprot:TRINITY_DN17761_c0_g1_i1.p1 TRINITY_DN17761_c0_g1~~TRINITY_DN17761_c0_g1_i1.p1  ORF type:complete len:239 (+),score=29.50 TRINITY_DN17761_c0_g1_i1:23-739(+)